MNEQVFSHIAQIVRSSTNYRSAIADVSAYLDQSLGGKAFLVVVPRGRRGKSSIAEHAERFFTETSALPYRSLYTVPLKAGGREWGRLVAFFAWGFSQDKTGASLINLLSEELEALLQKMQIHAPRAA